MEFYFLMIQLLEPLHLQILSFISLSCKLSATRWANRQIDEYEECHILMAGSRTTICRGLFLNGSFLMEPREMDMSNWGVPLRSFPITLNNSGRTLTDNCGQFYLLDWSLRITARVFPSHSHTVNWMEINWSEFHPLLQKLKNIYTKKNWYII